MVTKASPACGASTTAGLTVFFDGACPLCSNEIALYRRSRGAEGIQWIDASRSTDAEVAPGLRREVVLRRFHVLHADGTIASGGRAFADLWAALNQNRVLYKKMPYDPDKDFTYVSGFDAGHLPLAVAAGVKAANMREFVELAKRERVTMGTYAAGSYPHMVAQQLDKLHGTQIEAVHYKGEAPMWADLASGQITSALGSIAAMLPRDIVNRISALNQEAADAPRISTLNQNFGLRAKPWTAEEFEKLNREVGPQWIAIARELGVTLD